MYVTATGMVCSVGLNAASACSAMRAGISNFVELPYHDNQGEPIIGAMVPGLTRTFKCEEHLIEMLAMALVDCLQKKTLGPSADIPLLVSLAEPGRPGGCAGLAGSIIGRVQKKLDMNFHPDLSHTIQKGHTGGFDALRIARKLLLDTRIPACLICGVDSYINASSLLWLDQHWRLKTDENSDGVIPGEAAAAVLLQRQAEPNTKIGVGITGLGFGYEKANVLSEAPLLGLGLTKAASTALAEAGIEMHEVDFRLSDVTGESYGFKEQALALARLLRIHKDEFQIWHCAEYIGDTGASAGVSALVVAFHAFLKDYTPGDRAICYASAVPGERAVAVIERQKQEDVLQ
jgi:3-oxoacyl-[acyl-carrier-protein] synthase-1